MMTQMNKWIYRWNRNRLTHGWTLNTRPQTPCSSSARRRVASWYFMCAFVCDIRNRQCLQTAWTSGLWAGKGEQGVAAHGTVFYRVLKMRGVGDGQRGLACCSSWGCKESDTTEQLNWTELKTSGSKWWSPHSPVNTLEATELHALKLVLWNNNQLTKRK